MHLQFLSAPRPFCTLFWQRASFINYTLLTSPHSPGRATDESTWHLESIVVCEPSLANCDAPVVQSQFVQRTSLVPQDNQSEVRNWTQLPPPFAPLSFLHSLHTELCEVGGEKTNKQTTEMEKNLTSSFETLDLGTAKTWPSQLWLDHGLQNSVSLNLPELQLRHQMNSFLSSRRLSHCDVAVTVS